ncbi:HAD family hydrolase [Streptomyces sp. NPDC060322]|uniref:HAD family hydrolase n=1 Tax=Streptomyces sp. NPDC060322 TaxID=3347097 RepID=UPI003664826F
MDETLLAEKSMAAFWQHWLASYPSRVAANTHRLQTEAAPIPCREVLNRQYYRRYAGVPLNILEAAGRHWYDSYRRGGTAFVTPTLDAVAAHRAQGNEIVLVSGSMRPLLVPLAQELGATVRCTELVVGADGVLTGEVHRPMIGQAKADAAIRVMREHGADPKGCSAYGDHESDLALLRAVGHPVVVGDSVRLNEEAQRLGGAVATAPPGPLRKKRG